VALANVVLYCDQGSVERYLSAQGVSLRLDDDGDGYISDTEQAALTDALIEASETCNFYLFWKYTPTMLATSNWVNRKATLLAAYRLCSRRGNPPPQIVVEDAARVEEDLKAVADGGRMVPNLALRRVLAPVFSNTRVDPRYNFRCIRVERQQSSSQPSQLPQNTDWTDSVLFEY
jgi:phage gp36-like protein